MGSAWTPGASNGAGFRTINDDDVTAVADHSAQLRVHGDAPGKMVIHGRAAARTVAFDFDAITVRDWLLSDEMG
jgi:hypothetical protein